jgi:hypothetical protein
MMSKRPQRVIWIASLDNDLEKEFHVDHDKDEEDH